MTTYNITTFSQQCQEREQQPPHSSDQLTNQSSEPWADTAGIEKVKLEVSTDISTPSHELES